MLDLSHFTRPQLCGRIQVLRDCLRALERQAACDGQPAGEAALALERELAQLARHLRLRDTYPRAWPAAAPATTLPRGA